MRKRNLIIMLFLMLILPITNVVAFTKVNCGNVTNIPEKIPEITSFIFSMTQFIIPVLLIIFGMFDLFKSITAQKEDEIKKGRQTFVKRLIVGTIVFFLFVVVKLVVSVVSDSVSKNNIISCMNCFLNYECQPLSDS